MANKFYVVSGMARFDAIDANCVTVCRVAGLAPEIEKMKKLKPNIKLLIA